MCQVISRLRLIAPHVLAGSGQSQNTYIVLEQLTDHSLLREGLFHRCQEIMAELDKSVSRATASRDLLNSRIEEARLKQQAARIMHFVSLGMLILGEL